MPAPAPEQPVASDALVELAHAHGVTTSYPDWHGQQRTVPASTLQAVLAALGVPAATEEEIAASLDAARLAPWRRVLPPTVVARVGRAQRVLVHVPHGAGVHLTAELEDGQTRLLRQVEHNVAPREVDGAQVGEAAFEVDGDLPTGWHRLVAQVDGDGAGPLASDTLESTLIVTPERLDLPGSLAQSRQVGLMTQLYQVRSRRSWGIGDLGDLGDLARWAAGLGCDWVLVNPFHAAQPIAPMEPSPYLPTTRRFVNPVYLRVEDVPGYDALDAATLEAVAEAATDATARNGSPIVNRDAAWTAKRTALGRIHAAQVSGSAASEEYRAYREREGEGLVTFATWCALAELHGLPWTDWPAELRDPASPEVATFREEHPLLVDFHMWLQWLVELQLAAAQRQALEAGMALGVVHDLAVGVHPVGADAWGLAGVLARNVTVGAPPDQYNQLGQDWSQPPWRPDRLAEIGYAPYRDMVRSILRDSGGIRVDHIIGLFRLWWIPNGSLPVDGTYVAYDYEALIGILVLEAHRAGAVIIGEDLGLVPSNARQFLTERGLLGTSILWFEWRDGQVVRPEEYRELCLSSVTTHDMPPTAGYLELEHIAIRERLGLLTRSVAEERASEEQAIATVRAALVERGLLDPDGDEEAMTVALHRWLAATPSRMLGVALADVVGDRRAINQPGTNDEYPNWRLPLSGPGGRILMLEDLAEIDLARRLVEAISGR